MKLGALLLFAREPAPGRVKTRLVPPLTAASAARLYEAFLEDILRRATCVAGVEAVVMGDAEGREAPRLGALARAARVAFRSQRGSNLGERLQAATSAALSEGRPFAIALGGDHPTIPTAFLAEMVARLGNGAPAALVPSEDGGYCAIGLARPCPGAFAEIPWSTPAVLQATLAAIRRLGIEPAILPAWHDVDTPADLARLAREIADTDPAAPDFPASTARTMREIGLVGEAPRDPEGTASGIRGATPRISPTPKGVDP